MKTLGFLLGIIIMNLTRLFMIILIPTFLIGCGGVPHSEAKFPKLHEPWGESRIPAFPELNTRDQMMALHTYAVALASEREDRRYIWMNPDTGNGGEVRVLGLIQEGPYEDCLGLENIVIVRGRGTFREYPAACRGGGGSYTWIINRQWVISSVNRRIFGSCIQRFVDARIARGRVQGTEMVCFDRDKNEWIVGGW